MKGIDFLDLHLDCFVSIFTSSLMAPSEWILDFLRSLTKSRLRSDDRFIQCSSTRYAIRCREIRIRPESSLTSFLSPNAGIHLRIACKSFINDF